MDKYNFKQKAQAWKLYRKITETLRSQGLPLETIKIHNSVITVNKEELSDKVKQLASQCKFRYKKAK
ncbi:hypothetical protein GF358_02230 [Candidatus Woesearchaeota archaeon]|nr:hypothetical protein [Candidatus Woesearchaeota archaeon]